VSALVVSHRATLSPTAQPEVDHDRSLSWFITFGFGKPAAGMFTEVAFDRGAVDPLQTHLEPEVIASVLDLVARGVAAELYGEVWAFHYAPNYYESAVARYELRRRELVTVTAVEVSL